MPRKAVLKRFKAKSYYKDKKKEKFKAQPLNDELTVSSTVAIAAPPPEDSSATNSSPPPVIDHSYAIPFEQCLKEAPPLDDIATAPTPAFPGLDQPHSITSQHASKKEAPSTQPTQQLESNAFPFLPPVEDVPDLSALTLQSDTTSISSTAQPSQEVTFHFDLNPEESALHALQASLPKLWSVSVVDGGFNISMTSRDASHVVQRSVMQNFKGGKQVFVHGQELSPSHKVFSGAQNVELSSCNEQAFVKSVLDFVSNLRQFEICIGIHCERFKPFWKTSLDTCLIDCNPFHEQRYEETLRSKKCEYLVPQRQMYCKSCDKVRVRFANRNIASSSPSSIKKTPNKFKAFKHLNSAEKESRNRSKTRTNRNLTRENKKLREQLQSLIAREGIDVDEDFNSDLTKIVNEAKMKNDGDDFFNIFMQQQADATQKNGPKGMKWHPLMIRFALQLKMCSSSALKCARNFIKLPSDRTLFDYSHIYDEHNGCHMQFINETGEKVKAMKHDYQKYHVLMFDEITVNENLVQKKSTGEVVGYCKLNEVQTEILLLKKKLQDEAMNVPVESIKTPPVTKKMLTFMLKGTANDVCTSVASYSVNTLCKEDVHQYLWEVIGNLQMVGIHVIACVCDGNAVNRGFIQMQPPITKTDSGVVFDTVNPFQPDHPIYFISDPPHLLKTTRNALENSERKKSRCLMKNGEVMSWKTIIRLFFAKKDLTVAKLSRLTPECVFLNSFSRMRVSLAARVLSKSVAVALKEKNWPNSCELRVFEYNKRAL